MTIGHVESWFMENNTLFTSHLCETEISDFWYFCNFSSFWIAKTWFLTVVMTGVKFILVYHLKIWPKVSIEFLWNECLFGLIQAFVTDIQTCNHGTFLSYVPTDHSHLALWHSFHKILCWCIGHLRLCFYPCRYHATCVKNTWTRWDQKVFASWISHG